MASANFWASELRHIRETIWDSGKPTGIPFLCESCSYEMMPGVPLQAAELLSSAARAGCAFIVLKKRPVIHTSLFPSGNRRPSVAFARSPNSEKEMRREGRRWPRMDNLLSDTCAMQPFSFKGESRDKKDREPLPCQMRHLWAESLLPSLFQSGEGEGTFGPQKSSLSSSCSYVIS